MLAVWPCPFYSSKREGPLTTEDRGQVLCLAKEREGVPVRSRPVMEEIHEDSYQVYVSIGSLYRYGKNRYHCPR